MNSARPGLLHNCINVALQIDSFALNWIEKKYCFP